MASPWWHPAEGAATGAGAPVVPGPAPRWAAGTGLSFAEGSVNEPAPPRTIQLPLLPQSSSLKLKATTVTSSKRKLERLKTDKNTVEARGALYEFITLSVAVLISNKGLFLAVTHYFIPFPLLQLSASWLCLRGRSRARGNVVVQPEARHGRRSLPLTSTSWECFPIFPHDIQGE